MLTCLVLLFCCSIFTPLEYYTVEYTPECIQTLAEIAGKQQRAAMRILKRVVCRNPRKKTKKLFVLLLLTCDSRQVVGLVSQYFEGVAVR